MISEVTFQVSRDVDTVRTERTERTQLGVSETNFRTPFQLDMRWLIPDPKKGTWRVEDDQIYGSERAGTRAE